MRAPIAGEVKLYTSIVGGFAVCLWLFTRWLPAIGLGEFAARFEEIADKIAPCVLSPAIWVLISRLRRRGAAAFGVALLGGAFFLYWFFVVYDLALALVGMVLLGLGTWIGVGAASSSGSPSEARRPARGQTSPGPARTR